MKSLKLEGRALEMATAMRDNDRKLRRDQQAMKERHRQEMKALMETASAVQKETWDAILDALELDALELGERQMCSIDFSYLSEHGEVFLMVPEPQGGVCSMCGEVHESFDCAGPVVSAGQPIPDGADLGALLGALAKAPGDRDN